MKRLFFKFSLVLLFLFSITVNAKIAFSMLDTHPLSKYVSFENDYMDTYEKGIQCEEDIQSEQNILDKLNNTILYQENKGQITDTDGNPRPDILFTSYSNGVRTYFKKDGISYVFEKHNTEDKELTSSENGTIPTGSQNTPEDFTVEMHRIDLDLVGASNQVNVITSGKNNVFDNFYLGDIRAEHVYSYDKVTYKNIYPNIDMVMYTKNGGMKYDFIVHPGGDPNSIQFKIDGVSDFHINNTGDLIIKSHLGDIIEGAPVVFQDNQIIKSNYLLNGNILSFNLDNYNPNKTLIIDPTRAWGTYYTANGQHNHLNGMDETANANGVFWALNTTASAYPVSPGVFDPTYNGNYDLRIVHFDTNGNLVWGTYFGGGGLDASPALGIGPNNTFVLSGVTQGSGFPVTGNTFDQTHNGGYDYFISQWRGFDGTLRWSTYFGGPSDEWFANGVDVSDTGEIAFYGTVSNETMPIVNGLYPSYRGGGTDNIVAKFNSLGDLVWSSYFGGNNYDVANRHGIEFDNNHNIIILGRSVSNNLPVTPGVFQSANNGSMDLYLASFSNDGSTLNYATYIGDNNNQGWSSPGSVTYGGDLAFNALAICSDNSVIVGGTTWNYGSSNAWVYTPGAYSAASGNNFSSFILKFDDSANRIWGTTWAGNDHDWVVDVEVDEADNVFVLTGTLSTNLPVTVDAHQTINLGGWDKHIGQLSADGSTLLYGSYFGSPNYEMPENGGFAYHSGSLYCASLTNTNSNNPAWLVSSGAYQTNATGSSLFPVLNKFLFDVPAPPCDLNSVTTIITDATCSDSDDGEAEITINFTGSPVAIEGNLGGPDWIPLGTPPSNPFTFPIGDLTAGTYTITIREVGNTACEIITPFVIGTLASPPDTDGDGFTVCDGDCDDTDDSVYPGATEICDGIDNNCDGNVDESGGTLWYADIDGDGFGDANDPGTASCFQLPDTSDNNLDCNDGNQNINPNAQEVCDGVDNNCDGTTDEGFDQDGDGVTVCGGDCDDTNASVYPGAPEISCDGVDNDCNPATPDNQNPVNATFNVTNVTYGPVTPLEYGVDFVSGTDYTFGSTGSNAGEAGGRTWIFTDLIPANYGGLWFTFNNIENPRHSSQQPTGSMTFYSFDANTGVATFYSTAPLTWINPANGQPQSVDTQFRMQVQPAGSTGTSPFGAGSVGSIPTNIIDGGEAGLPGLGLDWSTLDVSQQGDFQVWFAFEVQGTNQPLTEFYNNASTPPNTSFFTSVYSSFFAADDVCVNPGNELTVTAVADANNTAPFIYTFNDITNATGVFPGIAAGTFDYSIMAANGCLTNGTHTVGAPDLSFLLPIPDVATLPDVNEECEVVSITPPTATDACGGTYTATTTTIFPMTNQVTTVIIWNYTNGNGDIVTQTQNVVIDDTMPPEIVCTNFPSITTDIGQCTATITDNSLNSSATDNCNTVTLINDFTNTDTLNGAVLPIGPTTINWTATDASGNQATCEQLIVVESPNPVLTSINPPNFSPGDQVVIEGNFFTGIDNVVTMDGTNAPIASQNATSITIIVPADICSGNILVTNGCSLDSNVLPYTINAPTIINVTPDILPITGGVSVVINGTNFSTSGNMVTIGGQAGINIQNESATSITVISPANICSGDITVTTACGTTSLAYGYTVSAPIISSINSSSVIPNNTLLISGANFNPGQNSVTINGNNAPISSENYNEIEVTVPFLNNACIADIVVTTCNSVSDTFSSPAVETELPTISCPANISAVATSAAGAIVTYTEPVGSDNCGIVSTNLTTSLGSGDTFPIGNTVVTYLTTDTSGNTETCSFTVSVVGVAPVAVCPNDITQNTDAGLCSVVVNFSATDEVGIPASVITYSQDPGTVFPIGTTTVTVTATNAVGSTTCDFDVVVEDNEGPTFDCPTNIVVSLDDAGNGTLNINDYNLNESDNCSTNFTVSVSQTAFTCADIPSGGTSSAPSVWINEIHYDNSGGDVGEFVEVAGTAGFDLAGYSIVLYNGSNGTPYSTISLSGSIDDEGNGYGAVSFAESGIQNGGPDGMALVDNGGEVLEFISYEGFFTASGGPADGLTSIDIGVVETSSTSTGESLQLTGSGSVRDDFTWSGPADDSPGDLNAGQTLVSTAGGLQVTITVMDENGNSTSCIADVSLVDAGNPIPDVATLPDAIGQCDVTLTPPTATDACTGVITGTTTDPTTYTTQGTFTVTWTYDDGNNNSVSQQQTVIVDDTEGPTFDCPTNIVVTLDDAGNGTLDINDYTLNESDNCSTTLSVNVSQTAFTCADTSSGGPSVWINEFHYDNSGGDVGEFIEVAGTAGINLSGYTLVLYGGSNPYNTISLSGTLPDESNGFGAIHFPLPANGLQNGGSDGMALVNAGSVIEFISYEGTINATSGPAAGMTSTDVGVSETSSTSVGDSLQLTGTGSAGGNFTWSGPSTDSPGSLNAGQNLISSGGGLQVSITVTDENGNSTSCLADVTLVDAGNPIPDVATLPDAIGQCDVTLTPPTATDACAGVITGTTTDPTTYTTQGTFTVNWTYDDGNNNSVTQQQTVIVDDTEGPTFDCPTNIVVTLDDAGNGTLDINDYNLNESDNCSTNFTVNVSQTAFTCADIPSGGSSAPPSVWINEFHYDNASGDVGEFVEVAGTAGLDLTGYSIVLYNGSNGTPYSTISLSGSIDDEGTGYGALSFAESGIQNGGPDGMALVNGTTVIEFISYEGFFTAVGGPADGLTSEDIGVVETSSTSIGESLQLTGSGSVSGDFTWSGPADDSPGFLNAGQTLIASGGGLQVTITVTDENGNSTSCLANVSLVDAGNPIPDVVTLPDAIGQCDVTLTPPTATDACSGVITGTTTDPTTYTTQGTFTVTWTYDDGNNNSVTQQQTVIVDDTEAPVITCIPDDVRNTDLGNCDYTIQGAEFDATFTDNCTSGSISNSVNGGSSLAGEVFTLGATIVTWTADDGHGNVVICSTTITVEDNESPVITCIPDDVRNTDSGNCDYTIQGAEFDATFTDNCTSGSISNSVNGGSSLAGEVFTLGATTVTWTADDGQGNVVTCITTITVEDNEAPVITCIPDDVRNTDSGNCDYTIQGAEFDATFTDNCTSGSISNSINGGSSLAGEVFILGVTTVTWTADDGHGQVVTCTTTITVEDNEAPVISCILNDTRDTDLGECYYTIQGNEIDATFTDNCIAGSITNSINGTATLAGEIFQKGDTIVTWTADDGHGQVVTCSTTITVEDNEAPIVDCLSLQIQLDEFGNGSIDINDIDGNSTDNCEIASVTLSQMNFDCTDIGGDLDTLLISEYIDGSGNDDCIEIFNGTGNPVNLYTEGYTLRFYYDGSTSYTEIPLLGVIADRDVYVICNPFGPGATQADQTGGFAFDGNDAIALSRAGNAVDIIGEIGVNPGTGWNVSPNTTFGTTLVRNNDVLYGNVTSVSGIGSEWTQYPQNNISHLGYHDIEITDLANNVILTVTDTSGNVSTCEGNVTVIDNTPPEAICQNVVVQLDANGVGSTTAQAVDNGSNDACGIASLTLDNADFTCADVGTNTVTLTVTDNNGVTSTCTATVTVEDNVDPTVLTQDITIQLDDDGLASITASQIDAGSNDACGIDTVTVTPNTFDCSNIGANTVTLIVTDINGNVSSDTATVTVEDMVNPLAVCNPITVMLDATGSYTLSQFDIDDIANGSSDACGIASLSVSPDIFGCNDIGANIVTLTITDNYGNTDTCTTTVTVEGIIPTVTITQGELPEFCQGAVVVLTANSAEAIEYYWNSGETTQSIEVGGNGIYGVLVTSATNCTTYTEYEVTGFDAGSLIASYTILAIDEVFLHGGNLVQTGGVGAMNPNTGNIKLHQASNVVEFAQAPTITLNQGSTVGNSIFAAANPTIPPFVYNTYSNGSSIDATINNNQTVTLTGDVYDVVTVKQNATVIFSQSNVYINELKTFDGASIEFAGCANVFINEKFMLAQNGTINSNGNKVVFYVDEDVQIEKGSDVRASIHAYNHEILAKGLNSNGNNGGEPTYMTGLFIAKKVHGNKNVIWNADDLCSPCPIATPLNGANGEQENAQRSLELHLDAWPNPSDTDFNLRLKTPNLSDIAEINVFDMNNRLVHKGEFNPDEVYKFGNEFDGGVYLVKVTQAGKDVYTRVVRF